MKVKYKCKTCGREAETTFRPENASEAERFYPMLVCNQCADARRLKTDSERAIGVLAVSLQTGYAPSNSKQGVTQIDDGMRSDITAQLTRRTQQYADACAELRREVMSRWTPEIVTRITNTPSAWWEILSTL